MSASISRLHSEEFMRANFRVIILKAHALRRCHNVAPTNRWAAEPLTKRQIHFTKWCFCADFYVVVSARMERMKLFVEKWIVSFPFLSIPNVMVKEGDWHNELFEYRYYFMIISMSISIETDGIGRLTTERQPGGSNFIFKYFHIRGSQNANKTLNFWYCVTQKLAFYSFGKKHFVESPKR